MIRQMVAGVLVNRALYELKFNQAGRAMSFAEKVRTEFPEQRLPEPLQGLIGN
jgi:hypothetical protein